MSEAEIRSRLRFQTEHGLIKSKSLGRSHNATIGIVTSQCVEITRHWVGQQIHRGGNPIDCLSMGFRLMNEHSHYLCERFEACFYPEES